MKKFNRFLSLTFLAIILSISVNVMGQNPFYVDIIQPDNTNIDWIVGQSYTISWDDNLNGPVRIFLWDPALNGGAGAYQGTALVASVTGSTWMWNTTGLSAATGYKIKVESINSPLTYYDVSKTFDLVWAQPNSIDVLQPNVTGIDWAWNTTHKISWTDNIDDAIDVYLVNSDLSVDVKLNAVPIVGTTYDWVIANTPGGNPAEHGDYEIRVQSALHASVNDISDTEFSISEISGTFKEIYQPNNASIIWSKTSTHLISWRDEIDGPVDIFVQDFGNAGPLYQIANDVVGSTFEWDLTANTIVPSAPPAWVSGTEYTVILKSEVDPDETMESTKFTINETVGEISTIYQPVATTSWTVGTTHLISWLDNIEEDVKIYYTYSVAATPLFADWVHIADAVGTTYSWDLTGMTAGTGHVRVIIASSLDPQNVFEVSDYFSLTLTQGTYIDVIQPSIAGISWANGYDYYISWDDDLIDAEFVDIYLCGYKTATGFNIGQEFDTKEIDTDVVGSTHVWTAGALGIVGAESYRIKIVSSDNSNIEDYSTYTFNISASSGTFITVENPTGGEYWMYTTSEYIVWNDNCPENVLIYLKEYLLDNTPVGTYDIEVGSGVSGSMYSWEINEVISSYDNKFKIYVESYLDSDINDMSNFFYIVPFGKSATSIGDIAGDIAANVVIYPNPTSGQFSVSAPGTINKVEVRNLIGQVLFTGVASTIDVSNYEAGLYIVNIEVEGQVVAKKLFVQ